jgi:hypothetical protein
MGFRCNVAEGSIEPVRRVRVQVDVV